MNFLGRTRYPDQPELQELEHEQEVVVYSLAGIALVALVLVGAGAFHLAGWSFTLQLVWAIGLWCIGMFLGFLFAIPKVLPKQNASAMQTAKDPAAQTSAITTTSASTLATSPAYEHRPNTNLEEISDWLTKIIVGVGLVQMKQLPLEFNALADQIVGNIAAPGNHRGFGLAILITFSTLGFLYSYLITRLFIQRALWRAETEKFVLAMKMEQNAV